MLLRAVGVLALLATIAAAAEMFNERVAVLEPFPREVARGKTMTLKGRVKGGFRTPELAIIAPSGKTYLNRDNRIGEHTFAFKVRFGEGPGPYRMEVLAHKRTAIRSAARFTVYYGCKRPPAEKEPPVPKGRKTPPDIHTLLLEKRFLARLNEFRRSVKLDPVGWNEAVAARAREHAVRMAKAQRRQHRFGDIGVREMLAENGAGPGGASGPDRAWTRVVGVRPFDRPAPRPPGPRVRNHVVIFIPALDSLDEIFLRYFEREAAFRLCALDPYCVELAVGAARSATQPLANVPSAVRKVIRRGERLVYYCVCFVQINDKTIIAAQDAAYTAVIEKAAGCEPQDLRRLGIWGRGGVGARTLVERALGDERPAVFTAAFDALLLLDERRARADLDRLATRKEAALRSGRYAEAVALFSRFEGVLYDGKVAGASKRVAKAAGRAARHELRQLAKMKEPQRTAGLESLRRRVEGLAVAAEVERALAKGTK